MSTQLDLDDMDAALVMRSDGRTELLIPDAKDENAPMSDNAVFASAVMLRSTEDPQWVEELFSWFDAKLEAHNKSE